MTRAFWTSFLDGFTGAGIFGDLRRPGAPTRMFKPEPEEELPRNTILVVRARSGVVIPKDEAARIVAAVRKAVSETAGDRFEVIVPAENAWSVNTQ